MIEELKSKFESIFAKSYGVQIAENLPDEPVYYYIDEILQAMQAAYDMAKADVGKELQKALNTIEAFKENDRHDRILAAYDEGLEKAISIIERVKSELTPPNQ